MRTTSYVSIKHVLLLVKTPIIKLEDTIMIPYYIKLSISTFFILSSLLTYIIVLRAY